MDAQNGHYSRTGKRMIRTLVRVAARIGAALAAGLLLLAVSTTAAGAAPRTPPADTAVASAAPQATAAPKPVFIVNIVSPTVDEFCLDQHYDQFGNPTTTVFAWRPCHPGGQQSPGNQLWRFEDLGNGTFKLTNKRGGYTWCLSAPNGNDSKVFAEYCVGGANPPPKQRWQQRHVQLEDRRVNLLHSRSTNNQCMSSYNLGPNGGSIEMAPCNPGVFNQHWVWSLQA